MLTYLIYLSHDEQAYMEEVKKEINDAFTEINMSNNYYIKKGLRKILRNLNKNIRFSGNPQTEAELLIHYLGKIKSTGINMQSTVVLHNLYLAQMKRIHKAVSKLHEDLQYDYEREIALLK